MNMVSISYPHKRNTHLDHHRCGDWFEQRRDFFIRQFFADFFILTYSFQELYQAYCDCRGSGSEIGGGCCLLSEEGHAAHCKILEQLNVMVGAEMEKGPIWHLKELCHRVWPEEDREGNLEGSLVDWFMGSIFHEAMRLREDVYILNSYDAAAFKKTESEAVRNGCFDRWKIFASPLSRIMDKKELIKRISFDVRRQMEQLAFLFGQTHNILRTTLSDFSENILLVRFFVEQEDQVQDLWGEELVSVFDDMFSGAPEQGFCAAGRSYMSGQWYTRALLMYRRALELECGCGEAMEKAHELEMLIQENSKFLGAA